MPEFQVSEKLISFLIFLPVFFLSLAIHEYSHAFSAHKLGDNTAKDLGRLTLNPIRHLDLMGSIVMPLISFASGYMLIGWAKPVPVNRANLRNQFRDDIIVSASGPFSNLVLAIFLFILLVILNPSQIPERLSNLLQLGIYFNIFLFVFNLLPIPPLDGSHILYDLFPNRFTAAILNAGFYGFFILLLFIYSPLWKYVIKIINFIFSIFVSIGQYFW